MICAVKPRDTVHDPCPGDAVAGSGGRHLCEERVRADRGAAARTGTGEKVRAADADQDPH